MLHITVFIITTLKIAYNTSFYIQSLLLWDLIEAARSYETFISYNTTRHQNPEDFT
jgi:hypothetical protein